MRVSRFVYRHSTVSTSISSCATTTLRASTNRIKQAQRNPRSKNPNITSLLNQVLAQRSILPFSPDARHNRRLPQHARPQVCAPRRGHQPHPAHGGHHDVQPPQQRPLCFPTEHAGGGARSEPTDCRHTDSFRQRLEPASGHAGDGDGSQDWADQARKWSLEFSTCICLSFFSPCENLSFTQ